MHWAVVVVVVIAGCGRWNFDTIDRSDGGPSEDAGERLTPQYCNERVVMNFVAGQEPVAIRAVALSTSYAVAVELLDTRVLLLDVDGAGALTALHVPFDGGYAPLHGIARLGERPIVGLKTGDPAYSYLKFLDDNWDFYATGPYGDSELAVDPPFAALPGATSGVSAMVEGGTMKLGIVTDADITVVAPADYRPTDVIGGSVTPTPTGARVVAGLASGTCETFYVSPTGATGPRHSFSPCFAPKVAALGDDTGMIVHRTAALGPFALHEIPAIASSTGSTVPIPGATSARITAHDDAYWIGHASGSHRALIHVESGMTSTHRDDITGYPFDLTARDTFWFDAAAVHVGTPCMQPEVM